MQPNIGISKEKRQQVADILSAHLADAHVLYIKLRKYHWNLKGWQFKSLHEFFEEQYTALAMNIDEIAERILTLGVNAPGTLREFLDHARLEEEPGVVPSTDKMMENLLKDQETIIRQLREDISTLEEVQDVGSADFLTGLLQAHEKTAWMMRSYLQEK